MKAQLVFFGALVGTTQQVANAGEFSTSECLICFLLEWIMDHVDQECSRPHSLMVSMLTVRSSVDHPAANREGFGGTRCLLLSKMGQTSIKQPYATPCCSVYCAWPVPACKHRYAWL